MSLSWRARRRWALVALLVGLPAYIVAAIAVVTRFDRPPLLVELAVFVALGILWALPLRFVFRRRRPAGSGRGRRRTPGREKAVARAGAGL